MQTADRRLTCLFEYIIALLQLHATFCVQLINLFSTFHDTLQNVVKVLFVTWLVQFEMDYLSTKTFHKYWYFQTPSKICLFTLSIHRLSMLPA